MERLLLEATDRLLQALSDPRAEVFLLLRDAHRPLSRKEIQQKSGLHPETLKRTLRFLYKNGLVDKIQGRQETHYYAILKQTPGPIRR